MPPGLVPEIFNAVDVMSTFGKAFRMIDAEVLERADIKRIVTLPTVRIGDAVRRHFALNDWHQGLVSGVRDDPRVNLSTALK